MQNRVTPRASCRSATCLRLRGDRGPRAVEARERLGTGPGLAVHVGDGCRALQVGDIRRPRPDSASNVHIAPIGTSACDRIARSSPELRSAVLERLGVVGHAATVRLVGECAVVLAGEELGDRAAIVVEEAIGCHGPADHESRERGQPGSRVVASQLPELLARCRRSSSARRLRCCRSAARRTRTRPSEVGQVPLEVRGDAPRRRACRPPGLSSRAARDRSSGRSGRRRGEGCASAPAAPPSGADRRVPGE